MSVVNLLIGNRVLIKPAEKADKIGYIIIPEVAREYTHRGTVIAIGAGRSDDPMLIKPGDEVLYSKDRVFPLEKNGETYFIVFQDSIHAVL